MKKVGVLMPVASLPSNHGVGDFGEYSYEFIDMMSEAGMNIWQMLPLNPLGFGNSPYQPYSSYAGDELYISLDFLVKDGLLDEVKAYHKNKKRIDYIRVRNYKNKYLRLAFRKFRPNDAYFSFIKQDWVYEYAVYLTLKKQNSLLNKFSLIWHRKK